MKRIAITLAAVLIAPAAFPQQDGPKHDRILADKPGLVKVLDDDGGLVETWHRGDTERSLEFHGGAVVQRPLLHAIFIGARWNEPALAGAKSALRSAVESAGGPAETLAARGVKAPAAVAGTRDLPGKASMNDLHIRIALENAMADGALSLRDENVVYVVFLAPGVSSSLGEHKPGRDYDSYHSHFHAHDTNVRYVVVPWSDDAATMREAMMRSTVRAIVNPDADAWY